MQTSAPTPAELQQRIHRLELLIPQAVQSPNYFEVAKALPLVEAITRNLFGDSFTQVECEDPEIPGSRNLVFRVRGSGEMEFLLSRYNTWHARLSEVPENVRHLFRLSIDAQE